MLVETETNMVIVCQEVAVAGALSKCSVIANLENAQNCRDSHSIDRNQLD